MPSQPLRDLAISETPVAVVDVETTGLTPGFDRVVEVSVVRLDPGREPEVVFDTLVNPDRGVAGSEIHGITDADVRDAPYFGDIAGDLIEALSGSVLAAYNVYFDKRFLDFELTNAGTQLDYPHFCVMYLRTMIGLGSRCNLLDACQLYDVDYAAAHIASDDALATARLLKRYQQEIDRLGISTYSDLSRRRNYKFNKSFELPVTPRAAEVGLSPTNSCRSRAGFAIAPDPTQQAFGSYWELLKSILADFEVSEEEIRLVKAERAKTTLTREQIRVLHARAFASALAQFSSDEWVDDREVALLRKLKDCLSTLGWAPGD